MRRLLALALLVAPMLARAAGEAPTFESMMAIGHAESRKKKERTAYDSFAQAAELARTPAQKAEALSAQAAYALSVEWPRANTESSCAALELTAGAARASLIYNLGRVAESVRADAEAAALYDAALALRPNPAVAARRKRLKAPAPLAPGADPVRAFCTAVLKPAAIPADFAALVKDIAKRRKEQVKYMQQRALGPRGEVYPVAFLCAENTESAAWLLQLDAAHRYLVAFDDITAYTGLDACSDEDLKVPVPLGISRGNALWIDQRHNEGEGSHDHRVAVRGGRPVIIWHQYSGDKRNSTVTRDFDKSGRGYEELANEIDYRTRVVLLDANGMQQVETQKR